MYVALYVCLYVGWVLARVRAEKVHACIRLHKLMWAGLWICVLELWG